MTNTSSSTLRPLRPTQVIAANKTADADGMHRLIYIKSKTEPLSETRRVGQEEVGVDPILLNLVKMRVAQAHNNPVGMEKHRIDLKAQGQTEERIDQLRSWRESSSFSDREKAALGLAEAISLEPSQPFLDQFLEEARRYFGKEELIALMLAIMAVIDWSYLRVQDSAETSPEPGISPHWQKIAHRLAHTRIILPET